jgi:murein DD-endopeptidase MepM/ murein hydrolase activator NlpD
MEKFPTLHTGVSGQHVRDAQWLLRGHNRYKHETYFGEIDGEYGAKTAEAVKKMKYYLGYSKSGLNGKFGDDMYRYLISGKGKKRRSPAMVARAVQRAREARKAHYYPLGRPGTLIGWPGIGTHSWWASPNNWESDNAVDIRIPPGTPVIAYADGQIGAQIGPLDIGSPGGRFAGNRLHLHTKDGNEFYYAHMKTLSVHAHQTVKAGQVLGTSGVANGVPHLHWACRRGNPVTLLKHL